MHVHASNVAAGGVLAAWMICVLPPAAALLAIVWYAIQIYESRTVQRQIKCVKAWINGGSE